MTPLHRCPIPTYFPTEADFRRWLEANHRSARELLVGFWKKGSGKPHSEKVGKISRAQLAEIAEAKKDQLNAIDEEGRIKVIAGTARSMGVEVTE